MTEQLNGFSLKLPSDYQKQIKILCATHDEYKYQYSLFDAAVKWAFQNKNEIQPIAQGRTGSLRSYYIKDTSDTLSQLEIFWDCSPTRALYSAIVSFLKYGNDINS